MSLQLDLTKNLKYDRLTLELMKKYLKSDSNGVDVGAHKGEILADLIRLAPNGHHFAFEPIPSLYSELEKKYGRKAKIFPDALSDHTGTENFLVVENDLAYSGLKERLYDRSDPVIIEIEVPVRKLDDIIKSEEKISFIKIDVEGGEFDTLKGANELLGRDHPLLLFEFGKRSNMNYQANPNDLLMFLDNLNYDLYTLPDFMNNRHALNLGDFLQVYETTSDYYFVGQ